MASHSSSDLGARLLGEEESRPGSSSSSISDALDYTQDGSIDLFGQPALRSKTGGWRTSAFILGTECCERLAFYGINANLVMYLTKELHQGNATAAKNVAVWAGTGYLTPLIGAFIADSFLGRFKTIAAFSTLYVVGLVLLTLSSSLPSLTPPDCPPDVHKCPKASLGQLSVFYTALYLVALGMGGIKPCVSAFGADQFDDEHKSEKKKKSHFFNWFYLSINLGALIASTVLVYVQDNISWSLGYAIPALAMVLAISCYLAGGRYYRHKRPAGSALTRVAQVLVAACRKWMVEVPSDETFLYGFHDKNSAIEGSRKIEHTEEFKFLDKAATVTTRDRMLEQPPSPWNLCTVSEVEDVKQVVSIMPIWASNIFFSTVFAQMYSLFVEQGTRMERRLARGFYVPPACMSLFEVGTVLLMVPLYDRVIVKLVRRYSGRHHGFTLLQRMGIGLFLSIFPMVSACLVERKRLEMAATLGMVDDAVNPVPMTIFWQVPQYSLIGMAETFTFVGQLEFFYEQAPDSMRSLGTALALTTYGLGYYTNSLMISVVTKITRSGSSPGWISNNLNRGHLDYYFATMAGIAVVNVLWYVRCARGYKYKETSVIDPPVV
ncbi:hypothetical protein SELMODRAFT_439656 [Selaginella moellendorffii]|uniref:NPF family transporter n=1 Tax=Selaginella moellendorffii TaxID=88036 RepID=D8R6S5_SELML|nr:hypothetical protein SELMODRAFT_439656 [Selaginella moellendorffii]